MRSVKVLVAAALALAAIAAVAPRVTASTEDIEFNDDFADEVSDATPSSSEAASDAVAEAEAQSDGSNEPQQKSGRRKQTSVQRQQRKAAVDSSSFASSDDVPTATPSTGWAGKQMIARGLEFLAMASFVVYAIVYLFGKWKNAAAAEEWHTECKDLLIENFAEVGIPSQQLTLIPESAHEFVMYGTGHKLCRSMTAKLTLPKRHDMVDAMQSLLMAPGATEVTVSVDLKPELVQGFVIAIVPTRLAKKAKHDYEDINTFAQTHNGSIWGLANELSVLTDCQSSVPSVLTDTVVKFLNTYKGQLQLVHYSDFCMGKKQTFNLEGPAEAFKDPANAKPTLTMRFKFSPLDQSDLTSTSAGLLKGAINLMETLARADISPQGKRDCQKKRANFTAAATREDPEVVKERVEQAKLDRLRAEKERYEAMDPDNPTRIAFEKQQAKKTERNEKKKQMKRGLMIRR